MRYFLRSNSAIFLPVIGAGAAFLLNVLLKNRLEAEEYGVVASLLFVVGMLFMLGAVGCEQVIVRLLTVEEGKVAIPYSLAVAVGLVILVSPLISYAILRVVGVVDRVDCFFIVCAFLIPISTIASTFFKVEGSLFSHYMMLNMWKLFLVLSVLLCYFFGQEEVQYSFLIMFSVVFGFIISIVFADTTDFEIRRGGIDGWGIFFYMLAGLSSIIGYAVFDGLDRFVIKEMYSAAIFGDYFFIFTFVLSPVGIVSAYYSTKRLVKYKSVFSRRDVIGDYFKVMLLCLVVAVVTACGLWVAENIGLISFVVEYKVVLLAVVLLAAIRGGYSMLSVAYTVVCSSKTLACVGVVFGVLSFSLYFMMTHFGVGNDLLFCSFLFSMFWLGRSLVYWCLIVYESTVLLRLSQL